MFKIKIPLTIQIFATMVIGLLFGSYFELYPIIEAIAQGFVMLLQMTALPYIALSLMVGFGSLTPNQAGSIVKTSLSIFGILTSMSLVFIFLSPIAFPSWENAAFYSANTVKATPEISILNTLIPSNPFNAFANGLIPSIVVFSILIGLGIMQVKQKRTTLSVLSSLQASVANITSMVMTYVAPIGIFCICYKAAATIDASQIDGLTVYVFTVLFNVVLLAVIVFPAIVASVTPFTYRQVIKVLQTAMLTALATGSFFAVIPIVVENIKRELANINIAEKNLLKAPNIFVPICFSLPIGGKLIPIVFVLFAAWFSGAHISYKEYIDLLVFGFPQLFATTSIATPNLLELFNVSNSMMELFIVAENLIVGRMGAVFSVSFAVCFTLLTIATMSGKVTIKLKYVVRNVIVVPVIAIFSLMIMQLSFEKLSLQYEGYTKFIERDFIYPRVNSTVIDKAEQDSRFEQPFVDVLTRIKRRGFIRVGYFRDDLPYAFHNNEAKLVGFDIEIINLLATDLDVEIEYVKIFHNEAEPLLASGYLDMTSGVPIIPDNMKRFTLTIPYSQQSIALIVKDKRRAEFTHWKDIIENKEMLIGIPETFFYSKSINNYFTQAKAWELSTPRLFFKEKYKEIDGMIFGAAAASAWTLLYPDYTVIMPKPIRPQLDMAFPINKNDQAFELFMRNWIEMKKRSGELDILFSYWIEGTKPVLYSAISNKK
ncbi:cation:dicarboxylate symporter family transporter [Thalassotalea atypica]|uniref:cation:dicarboxylate symporter family transporter n=1 Tax=Thalassotalea atypica TaxID=2054316 RepID=UPI002572E024|nr:cation:dicarboxylase symporter family transporter [Thalassotalea atypica]